MPGGSAAERTDADAGSTAAPAGSADEPVAADPGPTAGPEGPAVARILRCALAGDPRLGPVRLACIDGPAGSGKTTTAEAVRAAAASDGVRVAVLHLDDLYDGWTGLEGSLWARLQVQVLEPLRRGRPGRYQRYDWPTERFDDWVDVPVPELFVLEGCGSARRAVDPFASVRVWVEAPADLRLTRGLERDGTAARDHWLRWMRDEADHFARERTRERADVRLDAVGRVAP